MTEKQNESFDMENQWQLYLQRVNLKGKKMPAEQYRELKRAFFGALGQLLMLMKNEVADLSEDDAVSALESMINQVGDFWLKQGGRQN